jgi:tetratricopeptide (TPR) repeat protein
MWKMATPENWAEALDFFEKALALEPASVEAQSLLAAMLSARAIYGWTSSAAADIARAEALIGQALAASPLSPAAHYAKGQLLRAQHRCDEAIPEFETVIAINRNWVGAFAQLGWCKYLTGSIEEAIPFLEQAVRLSPRDRQMDYFAVRVGLVHLLLSRTDEAITWLKRARSARPASPFVHLFLASAHGLKGDAEPAGAELAEVNSLLGPGHAPSIASLGTILGDWWSPKVRGVFETTLFVGLRKAGMPEE